MTQKQARSQETEEALIRAALKLCTTKDASKVTVREICSVAGVSVGAFYHHYESRQDLFTKAYRSFDAELNRHMERRCHGKDPLQALTDLLLFQVSFVAQEASSALTQYYCAILKDDTSAAVSSDRTYYRFAYECVQRLADEGMLRPEYAPQKVADLCICFIRGCLIDWTLHKQDYNIVEHVRTVLPILFHGFLQK